MISRAVRSFRMGCWAGLAALAGLAGCDTRPLGDPRPDGGVGGQRDAGEPDPPVPRPSRYIASNRSVDILFLIDDSASMRIQQDQLARTFPVLMNTLASLPGGLPDLHIGVIASDMGAGDGSIASCDSTGGKNGIFQYTAHAPCTATTLQPGATFIANVRGNANYTGNLADVFTCIAVLGEGGCGFEHQFAALTRALGADGRPAPAENQAFLREDAYLAIVMLTSEDDCSARPGVPLYESATNVDLASQLGPPLSFRCNEFGHRCVDGNGNVVRPNRQAPNNDVTATVSYQGCRSNDEDRYLLGVTETANRLKALKADDGQIMLAAITGPRGPYVVSWRAPWSSDTSCGAAWCPWPAIVPSCTSAAYGTFADPAVRVGGLVDEFGASGLMHSICDSDFAPAVSSIAREVARYVTAPCIKGPIARRVGGRADCTVVDNTTGQVVPACEDTGGTGACWQLAAGAACGGVSVMVQGVPLQDATVDCAMCVPGLSDPARGCP